MPSFDGHANFAISSVATPPSPALSGLSLVLQAGDGAKMPVPAFNAVVWPTGVQPLSTNAEIVRVTQIVGDTLTIVRGPQAGDPGGINRAIIAGDQFGAEITRRMFTDLETATGAGPTPNVIANGASYIIPDNVQVTVSGVIYVQAGGQLGTLGNGVLSWVN